MEIRHYRFDRITLDPEKCFGKPCIRGLRIPVASILSYLSSGMSIDDILREWPELEREDIYQALGYAAWVMEERELFPLKKQSPIQEGAIVILEDATLRVRKLPITRGSRKRKGR